MATPVTMSNLIDLIKSIAQKATDNQTNDKAFRAELNKQLAEIKDLIQQKLEELGKLRSEGKDLAQRITTNETKCSNLDKTLETKQNQIDELQQKLDAALQKETDLTTQLSTLDTKVTTLTEQLDVCDTKVKAAEDLLNSKNAEAGERLEKISTELEAKMKQLEEQEMNMTNLGNASTAEKAALQKEKEDLQSDLNIKIQELDAARQNFENALVEIKRQLEEEKLEAARYAGLLQKAQTEQQTKQTELDNVQGRADSLQKNLTQRMQESEGLDQKITQLEATNAQLQQDLNAIQQEMQEVATQLNAVMQLLQDSSATNEQKNIMQLVAEIRQLLDSETPQVQANLTQPENNGITSGLTLQIPTEEETTTIMNSPTGSNNSGSTTPSSGMMYGRYWMDKAVRLNGPTFRIIYNQLQDDAKKAKFANNVNDYFTKINNERKLNRQDPMSADEIKAWLNNQKNLDSLLFSAENGVRQTLPRAAKKGGASRTLRRRRGGRQQPARHRTMRGGLKKHRVTRHRKQRGGFRYSKTSRRPSLASKSIAARFSKMASR